MVTFICLSVCSLRRLLPLNEEESSAGQSHTMSVGVAFWEAKAYRNNDWRRVCDRHHSLTNERANAAAIAVGSADEDDCTPVATQPPPRPSLDEHCHHCGRLLRVFKQVRRGELHLATKRGYHRVEEQAGDFKQKPPVSS
ncbi:hypothetical protein MRX96_026435 [Rhipicephalus microplus]